MKFLIVAKTLGPRFFPEAVMLQTARFAISPTGSIYLGDLRCMIDMLSIHKEGIQGSGEGGNGTVSGVKCSCCQYPLVNVLTVDQCDCIVGGGIKPFPNQLSD